MEHVNCPFCYSKDVGKIGTNQFYCWNCFFEYSVRNNVITLYDIDEEGQLTALEKIEQ
ncbi:hypothetical protein [Desulfuribacillus stibiiarsenatis]|uniref:hypothetical protein n=1 Tax=Desulfuribacillus stibiiarsenatis TaxID=1390249 RepID=UPI000A7B07A9|nr:hypothetical protein [Desulfuribacillus stibiiarsenatis]